MLPMMATYSIVSGPHWQESRNLSTMLTHSVWEDSRQGGSIGSLFSDAHTHYRHVDSPKMLEGMADHDSFVLL
jgi:hypothetical protein